MVLRLDDAGLATLIRTLRTVPREKRAFHLRRLAAAADPSPQLRYYRRRKAGRMSLHLEIDPEGVAHLLRELGISIWTVDKPTLKASIETFFEAWEFGAFHLVPQRDE